MSELLKFTIEIQHNRPVTYADLNQAYLAFADEFQRYLMRHGRRKGSNDLKLYIREMRSKVVTVDLVLPGVLPGDCGRVEEAMIEFATYLKGACDYLCGQTSHKITLESPTLENLCRLLEPVASDYSAQLLCYTTTREATTPCLQINNFSACTLRRAVAREMRNILEPSASKRHMSPHSERVEVNRPEVKESSPFYFTHPGGKLN